MDRQPTRSWRLMLALVIGFGAVAPALAENEPHRVRWSAPHHVGQTWQLRQDLTQVQQKIARRGNEIADQKIETTRIELAARVEVLEVDKLGRETRILMTIDKALLRTEGQLIDEIAKPGTRIVVELHEGKTTFRHAEEGRTLPELAFRLLPRVIKLTDGPVTFDGLFGADLPREVGSTWEGDRERLMEFLHGLDPTIQAEDASAMAELVGVATVGEREFLDVRFAMSTRSATPPITPRDTLPMGTTLQIEGTARFPADYSTGEVSHTLRTRAVGKFQGKSGTANEGYVFETSMTESQRTTRDNKAWQAKLPADESRVVPAAAVVSADDVVGLDRPKFDGPEEVLRRFLLATVTNDREGIKQAALPHAETAVLWRGETPSPSMAKRLKDQCRAIRFTRLGVGDRIPLPGGRIYLVTKDHVNEDRVLLTFPDGILTLPIPLVRHEDRWRVDAASVIRSLKTAARDANRDSRAID